jgi:hypothetical protein
MNFVFNVFSSSFHQSLHQVVNEMFSHKFSMCWNIGLSIKYVMNQDALHSPSAKALSNVILLGINLRAYIFCSFPFWLWLCIAHYNWLEWTKGQNWIQQFQLKGEKEIIQPCTNKVEDIIYKTKFQVLMYA